jgi:hypothetical protein
LGANPALTRGAKVVPGEICEHSGTAAKSRAPVAYWRNRPLRTLVLPISIEKQFSDSISKMLNICL